MVAGTVGYEVRELEDIVSRHRQAGTGRKVEKSTVVGFCEVEGGVGRPERKEDRGRVPCEGRKTADGRRDCSGADVSRPPPAEH